MCGWRCFITVNALLVFVKRHFISHLYGCKGFFQIYVKDNHLSILSEGHGVMRATRHLYDLLLLEVTGHQHWGHPLVD